MLECVTELTIYTPLVLAQILSPTKRNSLKKAQKLLLWIVNENTVDIPRLEMAK